MRPTDLLSNKRRPHFLTSYRHYLPYKNYTQIPFLLNLEEKPGRYIASELELFPSQLCSLSKHPMLMHRVTWLLIFILNLKINIFV